MDVADAKVIVRRLTPEFYEVIKRDLLRDEGLRYKPYKCSAGYWTVGIGWNLEAHGLPAEVMKPLCDNSGRFNDHIIGELFDISLARAITDAENLLPNWPAIPESLRRVFINMSFQLGYNRLSKFTNTLYAARNHDWAGVAEHMMDSKWAQRDTPKRAARLWSIVITEAELFKRKEFIWYSPDFNA